MSGVIARIALPPAGDTSPIDAFALDASACRRPRNVLSRACGRDVQMPAPVAEAAELPGQLRARRLFRRRELHACRSRRVRPMLPMPSPPICATTRAGLCLVADRVSPGLHAFAPARDGTLTALGGLRHRRRRAHVRDHTARADNAVPACALGRAEPPRDARADQALPVRASTCTAGLMVFDSCAPAVGSGPRSRRCSRPRRGTRFADRIELPTPWRSRSRSSIPDAVRLRVRTGVGEPTAARRRMPQLRASASPLTSRRRQAELDANEARIAIYEHGGQRLPARRVRRGRPSASGAGSRWSTCTISTPRAAPRLDLLRGLRRLSTAFPPARKPENGPDDQHPRARRSRSRRARAPPQRAAVARPVRSKAAPPTVGLLSQRR